MGKSAPALPLPLILAKFVMTRLARSLSINFHRWVALILILNALAYMGKYPLISALLIVPVLYWCFGRALIKALRRLSAHDVFQKALNWAAAPLRITVGRIGTGLLDMPQSAD